MVHDFLFNDTQTYLRFYCKIIVVSGLSNLILRLRRTSNSLSNNFFCKNLYNLRKMNDMIRSWSSLKYMQASITLTRLGYVY